MKILLFTDRMQSGGAETHIAALARGLRDRGVSVAVASGGGNMADALEREGIRQYRIRVIGRSPRQLLACRHVVRCIAETDKFEILHAHARLPALAIRGCREWKGAPAPVVTVHAAFRAFPVLSRMCYWGEQTIAVSEDLRADICDRFGVPAEIITVIPNGIDCRSFSVPLREPPQESILFASRLDNDCSLGADLLCRLAPALKERFPGLQITIAGGGNALEQLQETAKRNAFVHFTGFVINMPELYRKNQIFVGVSRAAMEAAACGCAVVLCGNEGYGGLMTPDNPFPALSNFTCRGEPLPSADLLFADLCRLLGNAKHRLCAARAAHDWVLREYNVERMVDRTLDFYCKLPLGKPNGYRR